MIQAKQNSKWFLAIVNNNWKERQSSIRKWCCKLGEKKEILISSKCVVPENIHTPPPTEEIGFSRGEGESICLIFHWGRGVTIGKYFQRVLVTRKRVITKKKHKTLPWQFICEDIKHNESGLNGHNKHILSVPWRDLSCENVPYGLPFSNRFGIRLNSSGCLFKKNCHLFERLGLSIWKKSPSVQTAWAIRSKKNLWTVRATEAICSQINFSRVSVPKPFRH